MVCETQRAGLAGGGARNQDHHAPGWPAASGIQTGDVGNADACEPRWSKITRKINIMNRGTAYAQKVFAGCPA
jgi:hypothetical protein